MRQCFHFMEFKDKDGNTHVVPAASARLVRVGDGTRAQVIQGGLAANIDRTEHDRLYALLAATRGILAAATPAELIGSSDDSPMAVLLRLAEIVTAGGVSREDLVLDILAHLKQEEADI